MKPADKAREKMIAHALRDMIINGDFTCEGERILKNKGEGITIKLTRGRGEQAPAVAVFKSPTLEWSSEDPEMTEIVAVAFSARATNEIKKYAGRIGGEKGKE